jgi:hypothetical protein
LGFVIPQTENRPQYWNRSLNPGGDYAESVAPNRKRFRQMIGVVDPRVSDPRMERFGDDDSPALCSQTDLYRIYQVRWPVLAGVHGEGLLLEPEGQPVGQVVALPDADWARKVASTDSKFSFMFTNEWEMPYFNLGSTFNYAEMAYLMVPRPCMHDQRSRNVTA